MLKRFEDLRFAIGTFFLIIGCLLLIAGFMNPQSAGDGVNLNLATGGAFIVFAVMALALSIGKKSA